MYLSVNLNFIAFALACMFILVPRHPASDISRQIR